MKYEVDYVSITGNTEKLVKAIALDLPPEDTKMVDLSSQQPSLDVDIYLVCFGLSKGNIPLKVMDLLEELEDKTLLLFITSAMEPGQESITLIERKLDPFMPLQCDYRGMFLCRGEFPQSVVDTAKRALEENPDDGYVQALLQNCMQTSGHPDRIDLQNARRFMREKLGMP